MKMCCSKVLCGAAAIGATTLIAGQVISQQNEMGQPSFEEMMEMMQEMAQPVEAHETMARQVGKWNMNSKFWMYPGAEPETSKSISTVKSIMGGRHFIEHVDGKMKMMGGEMDFEGMNLFGYDKLKKKYWYCWCDTMGTGVMYGEGTSTDGGQTITYMSDNMINPMTGQIAEVKSKYTWVNDNEYKFEMFEKGMGGEWFKNFEIVSTRIK